jgi:hypothetical protein
MSVRCISLVLEKSIHSGTELLMLVVLADYSDDDGNSYPGVASLARKCRMGSRNANYILKALQDSGELRVLKNEGPKGTNRYRIMLALLGAAKPLKRSAPLQSSAPLQRGSRPPATQFPKPLQPIADEPSLNRHEPSDTSLVPKLKKRKPQTLAQFLADCRTSGEKAIPDNDQIFKYAETIGLQSDMLAASWNEFKIAYIDKPKTYSDWRATFRNSVRGNWYKVWFLTDGEAAKWTTQGEQARRAAGSLEAMP